MPRNPSSSTRPAPTQRRGAHAAAPAPGLSDLDTIEKVLDRANTGAPDALAVLRKVLTLRPGLLGETGDLAHVVEQSWLRLIAGSDQAVFKEALSRHLKTMRRELGGDDPSPLEKLLINRICLNWLAAHHAECVFVQNMDNGKLSTEMADVHQKRIGRWQRMFLSSIRALATLRAMQQRVTITAVTVAHTQGADGHLLDAARVETNALGA